MSKEKKNKDLILGNNQNLKKAQDFIDQGLPINGVPTNTGLFNTPLNRTTIRYNSPVGAKIIQNQGAFITMGQIPLGPTETSGYGAIGLPAEAIDLVVGRGTVLNNNTGPREGEPVNNNHMADAARIYICRLTDIDKELNIESGDKDPPIIGGRSAVAAKADLVRLVGREGVKIVTGKVFSTNGGEEKNSLGGTISPAPKIDLVAGNNYDNVQGVALGERTEECFKELNKLMGEIWSAVYWLALLQSGYNSVVAVNPLTPWTAAAAPPVNMGIYTRVLTSLYNTRTSSTLWELNYLNKLGSTRIVSSNVRTN